MVSPPMTPTYLNPPVHYSLAEFRTMLAGLKLGAWLPKFPESGRKPCDSVHVQIVS
jgi:hypothetical protein